LHVDGSIHLDGQVIVDTQTGAQPFYITRDGADNQALKIYVDDAAAIFESIQDESADNYGAFQFILDSGVTEPYFDIRKGTSSSGVLFRVDGGGTVTVEEKLGVGVTSVNATNEVELHGQTRVNGDLFVGDASLANTAAANIHVKNSGSATIRLEDTDSTNVVFDLNSNEGSGFSIWEGSSANTRFHIDQSTGSIKINGTSPTDKLHVGGRTRSEQGFYSAYGVYTDGGTYTNQWQKVCSFPRGNAFAFANAKILINEAGDTSGQQLHGEVYFSYKFQSNNGRVNVNIRSYGERELSAANIEFLFDSTKLHRSGYCLE
jgi:archaellum component FlaF (FlaF/FlaG flagellin family)